MLKNRRKKKPAIEAICKNCLLYDEVESRCKVVIIDHNDQFELETDPEMHCVYDTKFVAFEIDPRTGKKRKSVFTPEVQEVKWWVEDKEGNKTNKDGVVKIQYPEGFFGQEKGHPYYE